MSLFIYNIHTPTKTFALTYKDGESYPALAKRIYSKAAILQPPDFSIVYEFEGQRWTLEDDEDLAILLSRIPPSSHGTTLHLTPNSETAAAASIPQPTRNRMTKHEALTASTSLGVPNANKRSARSVSMATTANGGNGGAQAAPEGKTNGDTAGRRAKSVMSTKSRRSKWGDDDAEPLGDVKRREWNEFHANNGVRTVIGKVAGIPNVRMLLKSGYKGVYISRRFAAEHGLIPAKYALGSSGYAGLLSLGNISITVGTHTGLHSALLSEETHFDVVLGRQWIERMGVKVDPLDPTSLTYMDTGESIPCDLVVLRDAKGDIITIT